MHLAITRGEHALTSDLFSLGCVAHTDDCVQDPDSYDAVCSDAMEWHESIDMSTYAAEEVCNGKCRSSLFLSLLAFL